MPSAAATALACLAKSTVQRLREMDDRRYAAAPVRIAIVRAASFREPTAARRRCRTAVGSRLLRRGGGGALPGELRVYLTASRSDLPALKEGAFEAAMVMLSPVRGLCP